MASTAATYRVGPPVPPKINHDNGFLDVCTPREASAEDRALFALWTTKLEVGEAVQGLPGAPDLPDALAAYRHFLFGNGEDREFSYERYVLGDPSGRTTLRNLIADAQLGAEDLYAKRGQRGPARKLLKATRDADDLEDLREEVEVAVQEI